MRLGLGPHMGRNVEAYIDDIVVTLIQDLEETIECIFASNTQISLLSIVIPFLLQEVTVLDRDCFHFAKLADLPKQTCD